MNKLKQDLKSYIPEIEESAGNLQRRVWINKFLHNLSHNIPVLYYKEDRYIKNVKPVVAEVCQIYEHHTLLRYKCYYPNGEFRCYLGVSVNHSALICGDERVEFFGDI